MSLDHFIFCFFNVYIHKVFLFLYIVSYRQIKAPGIEEVFAEKHPCEK